MLGMISGGRTERLYRYLAMNCVSHLALRSATAPRLSLVLIHTGWISLVCHCGSQWKVIKMTMRLCSRLFYSITIG